MNIVSKNVVTAFAFAALFGPSIGQADGPGEILANTVGRILIQNTTGNPVSPSTEASIRRIGRNPEAFVDLHTRPDMVAEKIRNAESDRRLNNLLEEQRDQFNR